MKCVVGASLGIDPELLGTSLSRTRLSIRIPGDITPEKVQILQDVDAGFIDGLKSLDYMIKLYKAGQFYSKIA
jgi:GMP synthase (glutamine-hydrolysing)